MPQLQHKCLECDFINKKVVSFIDPSLYTDPEAASVSYSYWCTRCGKLTGVRYSFDDHKKVVILGDDTPNSSTIPVNIGISPSPIYIDGSPNKEPSVETDQNSIEF